MSAPPIPLGFPPHLAPGEPAPVAAVRLVIIEDFLCLAQLLHLLCTRHWGLEVAAISQAGEAGCEAVRLHQPDLVLLDLGLPDVDGLTLLPRLRAASPASKIIIVSSLYSDHVVDRLQTAAWDGLIDKIADGLDYIREAIQSVRHGVRYASPAVRTRLSRYQHSNNPFRHMLSEREKEVLVCIAHALADPEIAARLGMDAATAKTHRKRLLKKLGQNSTPKLMHYAIRHGYGSLPLPVA